MYRETIKQLIKWKNSPTRKPMIVHDVKEHKKRKPVKICAKEGRSFIGHYCIESDCEWNKRYPLQKSELTRKYKSKPHKNAAAQQK